MVILKLFTFIFIIPFLNATYLEDIVSLKRKTSQVMSLTGVPFQTEINKVSMFLGNFNKIE